MRVNQVSTSAVSWEPNRKWQPNFSRFVLASMDIPESKVHSFVVKLWLEPTGEEPAKVDWHGYITHVPGGERRYLKKPSDVSDFIATYLEEKGARPRGRLRFSRCLRKLNLKLTNRP